VLEKPKPNENTVGAGNESWTFGKVEGKWKIRSFRYNVPDKEP